MDEKKLKALAAGLAKGLKMGDDRITCADAQSD